MESQSLQVPLWVKIVRADVDAKKSFLDWLAERKQFYLEAAVYSSQNFRSVLGCRFTIGELEAWKQALLADEREEEEYARYFQQVQGIRGAEGGNTA